MDSMTVKGVDRISPALPALPVGDARQEAFERALQGFVGKSMPVTVLARLADGTFLVRVAEQNARMALPAGAMPGTDVPMTLVSTNPRPAFQQAGAAQLIHPTLVHQDELRAPGAAALAAFRAQQAGAGTSFGTEARNAHVSLSDTGRAITRILSAAQSGAGATAAIRSPAPLSGPGTPEPALLARALEGALAQSGLFYESHVAEWAEGKRPLPELLREPQMQKAMADAAKSFATETDPAAAQLVSQQLATHEHGRIAWQGQVWPGQDMQWEIHKDAPEPGQRGADEAEPGWRSGLRLRFAALGEISATIVIAGDQLHIQLKTDSDETGALLRARAGELASALGASGSQLASLDIHAAQNRADG